MSQMMLKAPVVRIKDYMAARYGSSFKRERGDKIKTQCPLSSHGSKTGVQHFKVYEDRNSWFCHCVENVGWGRFWDLVSYHENLPAFGDPGFDETIAFVNDVMGLEPEYIQGQRSDTVAGVRAYYEGLAAALQPVYVGKGGLSPDNPHVDAENETYRGLPFMNWFTAGVGIIPGRALKELEHRIGQKAVRAALGGKFRTGSSFTKGVAILRYSPGGAPVGIGVRQYPEMGGDGKYLKNGDNELCQGRNYLFGLDGIQRADRDTGQHDAYPVVYAVEGEIDQRAVSLRGLAHVVACGNACPTEEQMARMRALGKMMVFIGDADGAKLFMNAARRYPDLRFAFLPRRRGEEKQDPDTFVQSRGTVAIERLKTYTARQVRMMNERRDERGRWIHRDALTDRYMLEIVDKPTSADLADIAAVAHFSGKPVDVLRSWLVQARTECAVRYAKEYGVELVLGSDMLWPEVADSHDD